MAANPPVRSGRAFCRAWRVDAPPDDVESILSGLRLAGHKALVQAFASRRPPDMVALEMLAAQTIYASASGATLANKPELDLLLRLAGTRQIGEALERHGYRSGRGALYVVAASSDPDALEALVGRLERDARLREVPRRRARKGTLELVERAALLSCGL